MINIIKIFKSLKYASTNKIILKIVNHIWIAYKYDYA